MTAKFNSKPVNKVWWLFGIVLLVNIVQSFSSALLNDEPYYWLYAQYLSWGYFDHPPMIALLIKAGSTLLHGEIGVRLLTSVIGSLTFWLIYKIIEDEAEGPVNFKLAALLLVSSIFLNLYSFLAIPDTPMLFFATLFLYAYRKYLNADTLLNAVALGVVAALLLYSKYHGILVIGFTVLSNPRLVFRKTFYLIIIITTGLYLPHINWQAEHDYPTIRFQFLERANAFSIQHVLSYIGEQAAVTGPVILLLFGMLYRPKNQFQKSLKYNVAGVFLFFLFSSFKDMVNVHWTAIVWPAMLCLAYLYIAELKIYRKPIVGLLIVNLMAVIVLRVNLAMDLFPISNFNDKNPRLMAATLKKESGGYPLVFADTYNDPAYFSFYSHEESFAVNDIWYKKTQYNYLPQLEQKFQHKTVNYVSDGPVSKISRKIIIPHGKTYYLTTVPDFSSFTNLKVDVLDATPFRAGAPGIVRLSIDSKLSFIERKQFKIKGGYLVLTFINNKTGAALYYRYPMPLAIADKAPFNFKFIAPAIKGSYRYLLSVLTQDHIGIGFNSNVYNCRVD
ncbi:glycosyltransferase family 39 protein [Mucilaginibacter sp. UR6-11]|uniref:ArnT family glycosyltransferase n=1 Tax=Mucilaginibacter sp. UR6-11 TaxID=1435644 RepID=UPI001E316005|nr:glycosyltransferase family 39 protein [Mucilaginibacter sp. UR6-11]MCC8425344.1 glycosyltransferase family 39 protein [Mucilaginibacter sp. UR6-11]